MNTSGITLRWLYDRILCSVPNEGSHLPGLAYYTPLRVNDARKRIFRSQPRQLLHATHFRTICLGLPLLSSG